MTTETAVTLREENAPTALERKVQEVLPLVGNDRNRAERIVRVAANAVSKNPQLLRADKAKLWLAIQDVVAMGLTFGPRGAYLVPYKNDVTVIVSPHGLIELAFRSPLVKAIQARVVYEKDDCTVEYAPEAVVTHRPTLSDDKGPMIGAYAVIDLTTGGRVVEWMTKSEVEQVKRTSQSAKSGYGPWKDWEAEMWRKTVLKRAMKYVPQSEELMMALSKDDEDHNVSAAPAIASAKQVLQKALATPVVEAEIIEDDEEFADVAE